MTKRTLLAVVGFLLVLPAVLLVGSGFLGFEMPGVLTNPVLIVGGLMGALAINLLPILRVRVDRTGGGRVDGLTVRIGASAGNLTALDLCVLLVASIAAYLVVENLRPRDTPYWRDVIW